MSNTAAHAKSLQEELRALSEGLLINAGRAGLWGNVLEIHHAAAPRINPDLLHVAAHEFGVHISLNRRNESASNQRVRCEAARLPFQHNVFAMVLLHHVISDGTEPELDEAVRVLARDGVLAILGINRIGWRFRFQGRFCTLPGMAPLKVKSRLNRLDMTLQGFAGAGLLGLSRPVFMGSGLAGLGAPIADVVLLQARHCSGPQMTPLTRSRVVQSA